MPPKGGIYFDCSFTQKKGPLYFDSHFGVAIIRKGACAKIFENGANVHFILIAVYT